ncbi:MAG: hemin uptake protein HemP [Burkholderiales bacterium]|nr:hemin uptake protein HemP [Burkholderiales bacterium]MBK9346327.1 hemin uptake protein HemP [Burkholderiales bacterium]
MTVPPPPPPHTQPPAKACGTGAPDPSGSGTVVHSSTLLQGQRTLAIAHNGAVYRLQTTRQGKLILTK